MMKLAFIACLIAMAAAATIETPAKSAPKADERSDDTKLLLAQKESINMAEFRAASPLLFGYPYGYGGYPYGGYPYGGPYGGVYPYAAPPISVFPPLIPPVSAGFSVGK